MFLLVLPVKLILKLFLLLFGLGNSFCRLF